MRVVLTHAQLMAVDFQRQLKSSFVGVSIGSFDGMHVGHQALARTLLARAAGPQAYRVLLTFNPHPRSLLKQNVELLPTAQRGPGLALTTFRERISEAERLGYDAFVIVHFNRRFAQLSARDFVRNYLVNMLHSQLIIVGHDFCFGHEREGSSETLRTLGSEYGFSTEVVPPCCDEGLRVSTSIIKQRLKQGEINVVNRLLGREYSVLGRIMDCPNQGQVPQLWPVRILKYLLPTGGSYAARIEMNGQMFLGQCYLKNSAAEQQSDVSVAFTGNEVFGEKLRGQRLRIYFIARLNDTEQHCQ